MRQRAKLEKNLGSIADLTKLPAALFVVDVMKENIAVAEAQRLGIPVFGIVDTNSNPNGIDYVIPANDDATKSIEIILTAMVDALKEGMQERKVEKSEEDGEEMPEIKERRTRAKRAVKEADSAEEAPAASEE